MKQFLLTLLFSLFVYTAATENTHMVDLTSNQFTPTGWVEEYLQRQHEGLGGNPHKSGYPFNTGMWLEEIDRRDRLVPIPGGIWWPYEQTAYYLDGTLRCGHLIGANDLLKRAEVNIQHVLKSADEKGLFHIHNIGADQEGWPLVVMLRTLVEQAEIHHDKEVIAALDKHFKAHFSNEKNFEIPIESGFAIRPVLQIELLGCMYMLTDDEWYAKTAERYYNNFQEQAWATNTGRQMLTAKGMTEGVKPRGHAVTYHEFLKLPAVLYMITGKELYREALYAAYKSLKEVELSNGSHANYETLKPRTPNEASEMCSTIDFVWTSGWALLATSDAYFADKMEHMFYNACLSGIKKDFKAYQYYLMPNLIISANGSSFFNDNAGWGSYTKGRLCYRPGHDTECCAGNIHRMLPIFINRSVIHQENDVKLALYMPGTTEIPLKKGNFAFTQTTNYPFEHNVQIKINEAPRAKVNFGLRIPGWATSYTISLNGKKLYEGQDKSIFKSIERNFKVGDQIELVFNAIPQVEQHGDGLAISYGPLVYAHPIPYSERHTTWSSIGKCSTDYPAYEYTPYNMKAWAVGLPTTLTSEDIEVVHNQTEGYPWDENNSPISLHVKGRKVTNWLLQKHNEPSAYPEKVETDKKDITLKLVPTSTAILKITEFPKYK